jgi:hypothetical protein
MGLIGPTLKGVIFMTNRYVEQCLDTLKTLIRQDRITVPGKQTEKINFGSLICFTEEIAGQPVYGQVLFDDMPDNMKHVFLGKKAGDKTAQYKIIKVYDAWE